MSKTSLQQYAPIGVVVGVVGLVVAVAAMMIVRDVNIVVQVGAVVALVGFAAAILMNPEAVRAWLGGRQARHGSNALLMILAFLGSLVIVNYFAYSNPLGWTLQWDFSEGQSNTLAPESVAALEALPGPVKAVGFYSDNVAFQRDSARELLDRYRAQARGRLAYEFVDPLADPVRTNAYGITADGTLILELGDLRESVEFESEQEITGALIRLTQPAERVVYFLVGHGEWSIDAGAESYSRVVGLLRDQNYEVRPLSFQVTPTVPSDAAAVVIAGPQVPLSEPEVGLLDQYLSARPNGSLIVLLDPLAETNQPAEAADPLVDYLRQTWGLNLRRDVIVDTVNPPMSQSGPQPLWAFSYEYGASPITDKLERVLTYFPVARSLEVVGTFESLPNVTHTPLIKTHEQVWGETDLSADAAPDGADARGPLTIGVAASDSARQARLVVFGDSNFASDQFSGPETANARLFANSVNWATLDETLINLTPKIPTSRSLILTDSLTFFGIVFFVVIAMPAAVLLLGGVVWFMRRRHV